MMPLLRRTTIGPRYAAIIAEAGRHMPMRLGEMSRWLIAALPRRRSPVRRCSPRLSYRMISVEPRRRSQAVVDYGELFRHCLRGTMMQFRRRARAMTFGLAAAELRFAR